MRRAFVLLVGSSIVLLATTPALAAVGPNGESVVVLTGDVVVPAGETVEAVFVLDGSVDVMGRVTDAVVVLNGPTRISGRVDGDVAVLSGRLFVADGAVVAGDVYAEHSTITPGATVEGVVRSPANLEWAVGWASAATALALWFAIAISVLLLGLALIGLAPRAADAADRAARTALGPSIGWGAAVFFGIPIVAALAVGTLVGIPLGIALLLGLALIFAIGQTVGAWLLGRRLVAGPSRAASFLLGWAIVSGLGLVPGLGALMWFAATVVGLGALSVAAWRARTAPSDLTTPVPPPMPVGA